MTSDSAPAAIRVRDLTEWFAEEGQQPLPFQKKTWRAIQSGESGLVHAPTGTGKTYGVWLGALRAFASRTSAPSGLTVLWITPLRALATDTCNSLSRPLERLGVDWSVGVRTGDTTAAERRRQRRRLPAALITTPESLSLLLSYADTDLTALRMVVVDEWHELLGSKRGVQLELCLAHLRRRCPALQTWGLSATLGNVQQSGEVLLGSGATPATIINGAVNKSIRIESLLPPSAQALPWAGHLGTHAVPEVAESVRAAVSTLVFTNTRAQAERWFEALSLAMPDWLGRIALHHGSIDTTLRREIERRLASGELRCVVATSSLDLGVDFSPVEQVIQIGSPKGVARLAQRAGRSGHAPGRDSVVKCVPTNTLQLIEIAAARAALEAGRIEARVPLRLSFDVLVQHLVTLALAGGLDPEVAFAEVRQTHAFAELTETQWRWILDFVTTGGSALRAYPDYRKLSRDGDRFAVSSRRIAQRHRMAIGTITSDSAMQVKFTSGGSLGTVEESTISKLQPGDSFRFAGRRLELVRVKDMTAYVRLSRKRNMIVPRWSGGRMPLSTELGAAVLQQFDATQVNTVDSPELNAAAEVVNLQRAISELPGTRRLLVEKTHSRDGHSLFVYPFAGRLVHEGLGALVAWRLSRKFSDTFTASANDYGFEVLSQTDMPVQESYLRQLLSVDNLQDDILQAVNASEMARRQFRDIARIAGLVFQGYPGARKAERQVQASSGLLYDVLLQYDPDNLLPQQALDEVLRAQFELSRLQQTLEDIRQKALAVHITERLSPLAFPLWADRLSARVSSETWLQRVERMRASVEKSARRRKRRKSGT